MINLLGLDYMTCECIEIAKGVIESAKDKLKYARSCTSKKNHKKTMVFYEAICYHLERLKKMESEIKNK